MPTGFLDLPNELIFEIFLHVSPSSAPALQQICRRLHDLVQPLLWRHHCRTQFRYWSKQHDIEAKFSDKAANIDWKKIFLERHTTDRNVRHDIDSILASQVGRIQKSERTVGYGYDAKDTLMRDLRVGDEAEDVLARRYSPRCLRKVGCDEC